MENSYLRKNQIKSLLERQGTVLDETYVSRGRDLLALALSARSAADAHPRFSRKEVEEDLAQANRLKPKAYSLPRIISLVLLALGLCSLLLPIDPFLSRLPICGAFVGLGGVIFFSDRLCIKKYKKRADAYKKILDKYGAADIADISENQSKCISLAADAKTAEGKVLQFVGFSDSTVATLEDCSRELNRLEVLLREYRSL